MAAAALIAAAVQIPAIAVAADHEFKLPPVQHAKSVPLSKVEAERRDPKAAQLPTAPPAAAWPKPGKAEVALPPASAKQPSAQAKASGLPLTVTSVGASPASGEQPKVRVGLSDRAAAASVGLDGVLVDVEPVAGSAAPDKARVQLDYKAFRESFGADWGSRLTFVQLPACALTTPDQPQCRTATPLAASNDTKAGTLTADVAVTPAVGQAGGGAVKASFTQVSEVSAAGATVLAATAGASGPEGDYKATSLAPSGSWSVGGNTGSFSWFYPIALPPVPGDLAPKVALGYSSAAIDGRTATTNNQSSWIGDGWEYNPGYVERSYTSCAGDKGAGSNAPDTSGDLCWKSDNASISLNGNASALVRDDATGTWKLSNDDGSRVEKLNGNATDTANGDTDNEYWKVTTTDGAQYFFGKNRLPGWSAGKPETGSALTVPVFGNHPGEPGYAPAFKDSVRDRAWRWQLDYVVDPHGNAIAYFYDQEKNAYTKNIGATTTGTPKADAGYTRASTLNHIEYGHRAGQVYSASPAGKVTFSTADRCVAADCSFTKANAANWYDTPVDQSCDKGQDCRNGSPTFWSKKRLTGIGTQALQGDGSYKDVDSWSLDQDFPATGDSGGRALWLKTITRTAKAGSTQQTLQPVVFGGDLRPNRVDSAEGRPPMNRYRVNRITSETGSNTDIKYTDIDCVAGALPTPDSNTRRCYPSWWTPEGAVDPVLDWFHKYLVEKVTEHDLVAGSGSPDKVTTYEYPDGFAWRRDNSEFTPDKQRTWNDFRGAPRVLTRVGASDKSLTETRYFLGMDGDTLANGQPRPANPVQGVKDSNELAGYVRETIAYDRDGGKPLTSTVKNPWTRGTATRAVKALPSKDGKPTSTPPGESGRPEAAALPPLVATMIRTESVTTKAFQPDGSTARTVRSSTTFDDYGQIKTVSDEGDTNVTGDEQCTRTTYVAPDTANWLISYPQSVQTSSTLCSTDATPATVTSETRTAYDGRPVGKAPEPGKGYATSVEALDRYDGSTPHFLTATTTSYDQYGRVTSAKDVNNAETTTSYTPASGSQATVVQSTSPKKFTSTTTYDGLRALPVKVVDANNRTTYADYDALGRTTAVWNPGRDKSASPSAKYTYTIEPGKQPAVTTKTLLEGGGYRTSISLYDGLLRPRQVQEEAYGADGGRNITDSFYDSHSRVYRANAAYHAQGAPEAALWIGLDNQVPSQTETEFDGLDRPTASIFKSENVEKWRTTTRYGVNWSATTPPLGGTPTLTITDAHGRPSEVRHYKSGSPDYGASASAYETLKYSYDPAGKLTRFTDAAGNAWSWEYDLLGRQTKAVDPDKGTTTSTYNADSTLATVTDGRGKTLAYTYDILRRKTAMYDGSTTGTKLAEWAYDTLPGSNGLATGSTRFENGKAFTTAVTGFDGAARPTGTTVTIPDSEELLAGTYTTSQTYTPDTGLVDTTTYPAGGGLAAESVHQEYTPLGLPTTVTGSRPYSSGNEYTEYGELGQTSVGNTGSRVAQTFVYENATRRLALARTDRENGTPQKLDEKTYTYNPVGNITGVHDVRDDTTVTDTQCYTYDFVQRLTNAWSATDNCVAQPDSANGPFVGGADPYWTSYTYDAAGNRTQATNRTSGAAPGPLMDTTKVTSVAIAGDGQTSSVAISGGQVYLAQQRANGTWRNYENLHTTTKAGALPAAVEHVAAVWSDNTLQIMAIAGGKVWHTRRMADGTWQPWGDVTGAAGPIANPSQLSLSATASGLEVLTFSDGVLKHTLRKPTGEWGAWGNVYGEAGNLAGATRVTSAATSTGLEVMVLAGGKLWHTVRFPTGNWQKWGDVYSMTGALNSPTNLAATATGAGLEVVTIADGTIWHTVRRPDSNWQPWGNVSQVVGQLNQPVSASVVSSGGDLKLITAAGGTLNYTKRAFTDASWTAWTQLTQTTENQQSDQTQRSSTYPAPGGARPHALSRVDITGTGARTDTFSYDEVGNTVRRVTADGDQTLEWDIEGHLAKSTTAGKSTTFLYDADGNRLLRREPDSVTLYLGGGQELKLDKAAKKVTGTRYINAGAITIVKSSDGSLNYLIPDRQGTAQLTISADSPAYTRGDTTAFGTPRGKKPASWPTERGFVGGTNDATTGLTHLGAREYDAANGRFISVDPLLDLTDPQQINGYAYSNNNPVNLSDPSGLHPDGTCGGFGQCQTTDGHILTEEWHQDSSGAWQVDISSTKDAVLPGGIGITGAPNFKKLQKDITETIRKRKETFGLKNNEKEDYHQYVAAAVNACFSDNACLHSDTYEQLWKKLFSWQLENIEIVGQGRGSFASSPVGKGVAAKNAANAAKKSGGKPSCNSFPPDTLVLMADGTTKPIGEIGVGDTVAAADPQTGQAAGKEVTDKIVTPDDTQFTELTLSAVGEEGSSSASIRLVSTAQHPYWDDTDRQWILAEDLQPGHRLFTADHGSLVVVSARTYTTQPQVAHNLTVADLHTYYVLAGATPVLVHNSNCDEFGNFISGSAEAQKLAGQLRAESASSPFTADGRLTQDAINASRMAMPGSVMGNKELQERFAARGGAEQWGKWSTGTHQSPYGDYQVHFYRNSVTGEIMYDYDYKVVLNRRGSK
ncbi:polymorphic toxin-type HINT domain-containing protein [Kitasatospora brasiliensis]|uniref:polymorphic toxin-type HINT domain-containing protein n=1 Tax=Kitasatospora brasiliensis TaxID=3058040 RepID=UPI00292DA044|nr:polymorphic toxin-type HINT domain-containing protein [Kitasatospora sp. K002]